MLLQLKSGVRLSNLQPQMNVALMAAVCLWTEHHEPSLVITSGSDGNHSNTSLHYAGNALDLRTRDVDNPAEKARVLKELLGRDFDVLYERDHIHIEYQPRRPL